LVRRRRISYCDLPFDLAQDGGELVEPFGACILLFENFKLLKPYMKLHIVGTANRRITNIEPQNVEGWNRFAQSFLK
jgi:hypothetical protein